VSRPRSDIGAHNPDVDDPELRGWFDGRTASHEFSGVALAWRNGRAEFSYAGGMAHRGHGVPITERTRFGIASVTKMVTATTVLRLVDHGLVGLAQPLLEILPEAQRPRALTAAHTVHHVLSHTSGLRDYHDDEDPTSFASVWDRIPTYHVRRPADALPLFADLPAVGPPGERFRYVDANFILAGLVIEAVTGRAWDEVAADEVLRPVGMVDTAVEAIDDDPPRLATGYLTDDGPPERPRANIFSLTANGMPDGGMISTAMDLTRFVDALLGGRLLSPPLLAAMTRPQGPASADLEQYGYGCWLVVERGSVTIIGHGGGDPGVSARVAHHLTSGTTIVVLCNQDRGSWAATREITEALGLHDPREIPTS
jgi:CubicO group peptidase (beta-lactamase class C family)